MTLARPRLRPTLAFALAWLLFDVMLNVRYPGEEPDFWYLLPSLDVIFLLCALMLLGATGRSVSVPVRVGLVAFFFFVRLLRVGDGMEEAFFSQPFHLYTDLALVPELFRFAFSTLAWWQLTLGLPLIALGSWGLSLGLYRSLVHAERYLRATEHRLLVSACAALAFAASVVIGHLPEYNRLYWGGFASSSLPRLRKELVFSFNVVSERAGFARTIAATEKQLAVTPSDLKGLGGRNVFLFVVESYGETVFRRPAFVSATRPLYDGFETALAQAGFEMATGVLESSTYGGRSWLAQATLSTGVKTTNQLEYALLLAKQPQAIAKFFERAGYRSVLAQPGTTRPWPKGAFYGFNQRYYAWNFDYRGPSFDWATMPDQFVVDFVHRREVAAARGPLFIEYVLVSSHAPWSIQPRLVEDWSTLGDGSLFNHLKPQRYAIDWPKFQNASDAYIRSIAYDLQMLQRYILDNVRDDSLIIVLGDHQPMAEVSGHTASRGVPVHVLSRNSGLVRPFLLRGYRPGMRPGPERPEQGLETFLPNFLADFSRAP
jgi:Sulfatase